MSIVSAVRGLDGIARSRELAERGFSARDMSSAVRRGVLIRLRVGWFGLPSLPDAVIRAHRVGGRPACATVAAMHGVWMLQQPILHIEAVRGESRFRTEGDARRALRLTERDDVIVHWVRHPDACGRRGQTLAAALRQLAECLPAVDAVCAIDSAVSRRLVTPAELVHGSRGRILDVVAQCDGRAESGVESIFRSRASAAGYVFRTQVEIPGGRVDFLFGDRLVVEVDGSEFHSGHAAFVADRERDAWHTAIGYFVVCLTYAQVVHRWHEVESLLTLLHARGEHLAPSRFRTSRRLADP